MGYLKRNGRVVLAVVGIWVLAASLPAVGHGVKHAIFAHNADKVDGKHAVKAGASPSKRARKLVATNAKGKLPTNIIGGVVLGAGRSKGNRLALAGADAEFRPIFTFPGLGTIEVRCGTGSWGVEWAHPAGVSGHFLEISGSTIYDSGHEPADGSVGVSRISDTGSVEVQAGRGTGAYTRMYFARVGVVFDDAEDQCYFHGHAVTQGKVAILI